MWVRLLLVLLIGCSSPSTEKTYRVIDYRYKGDFIIIETPDVDIGTLVFRKSYVHIVQSDTSLVKVIYKNSSETKVDSIYLFLKVKTNL